jgi:eukaryotic-like serine/threonine-protein kinase
VNAILALSCSHLGQVQNASNALALSRDRADRNSEHGFWFDWTLARILMGEAAAVIESQMHSSSTTLSPTERAALLRRQEEARRVIATAVSLVGKNQMAEADHLIGALPMSGDTGTTGVAVFRALGDWAATQGNWRRAAEYYSVLVSSDRFEAPFLATQDFIKYAVIVAEPDDRRAYENVCRESIIQFGENANPRLLERIIKICSLVPESGSLSALSPLSEKLRRSIPVEPGRSDWALPWQCMSLALFEYRRGNYAEAINWGNRCLSFKQDSAMERAAGAQAILAMSYYQVHQTEQAQLALRKSRELIEERWKTHFVANDNSRGWWYDWFFARILEREASATIESAASATKNNPPRLDK